MQKQAGTLQGLSYVEQNAGGGHPGGGQHHCAGDVSAPLAGLALHPVLCLQALQREEEEKEEEEGPQPARPLHIIAAPLPISPAQDHSTNLMKPQETRRVQVLHGWSNNEVLFQDSTDWKPC